MDTSKYSWNRLLDASRTRELIARERVGEVAEPATKLWNVIVIVLGALLALLAVNR